jgi:hypothetical protein
MGVNTANLRGPWAVGTAYAQYDVVDFEGYKYECINASGSTGNDPSGDTVGTYWALIASDGNLVPGTGHFIALNEATYQAVNGDVVLTTVTGAVTLPAPQIGAKVDVISNGASITCTVTAPAGSLVNGAASVTVTTQYTKKAFYSDGTNWFGA